MSKKLMLWVLRMWVRIFGIESLERINAALTPPGDTE